VVLVSVDGLAGFYLDDPRADLPTLHRMAAEGARASCMLCSFPTVTWPNHTTLVTGVPPEKHGVIGNKYFDRSSGKSVALIGDASFDKDQIVKVPTIYDVAHEAGLKTAGVIWPAKELAAAWQSAYNHDRPHSSLGYQTPAEFAAGRAAFATAAPPLQQHSREEKMLPISLSCSAAFQDLQSIHLRDWFERYR
jgi:hypothetical protein